jgi:ESCRT-I complex subunit MVB12
MRELYNALPDDRPINAVCVVEDVSKCPAGFTVVAKSYDQDLDADLWKDGFFGKRIARYLCLSKSEGPSGFVIDSLCVINERDSPPNGYILLAKTWRSGLTCFSGSSLLLSNFVLIFGRRTKGVEETATLLQIEPQERCHASCH